METNNLTEVTKKQNAFASYAVESHNLLANLQTQAAQVIANLSDIPTKVEQIVDAEATLKASKAKQKEISASRLAQTSKLDKFFENFMAPEKSILAAVPAYEQAIIKLKNEKSAQEQAEANKQNELKKVREIILSHLNNEKARIETMITDYVSNRFAYALKNATSPTDITVNGESMQLEEYIKKCQYSKNLAEFVINPPVIEPKLIGAGDILAMWTDESSKFVYTDGKLMMGKFDGDIKEKFKYLAIALKDKEKAAAHNEQQALEAKAKIDEATSQANIGAKLAVNSSVLDNGPEIKALKEKFYIDMESSEKSALTIMVAFATNIDKVRNKVKADWMKLSVAQMGAALAAVKNDDNKFEVTGINFKVIQKL